MTDNRSFGSLFILESYSVPRDWLYAYSSGCGVPWKTLTLQENKIGVDDRIAELLFFSEIIGLA